MSQEYSSQSEESNSDSQSIEILKQRLFVGSGNLSFELAFARKHPECATQMIVTTHEPLEDFRDAPFAMGNKKSLIRLGVMVFHGVDATMLENYDFGLVDFKHIYFCHPHTGNPNDHSTAQLINEFFKSAAFIQKKGYKIHIIRLRGGQYEKEKYGNNFNLSRNNHYQRLYGFYGIKSNSRIEYELHKKHRFNTERYSGYFHQKTLKKESYKNVKDDNSLEYVFKKTEEENSYCSVDIPSDHETDSDQEITFLSYQDDEYSDDISADQDTDSDYFSSNENFKAPIDDISIQPLSLSEWEDLNIWKSIVLDKFTLMPNLENYSSYQDFYEQHISILYEIDRLRDVNNAVFSIRSNDFDEGYDMYGFDHYVPTVTITDSSDSMCGFEYMPNYTVDGLNLLSGACLYGLDQIVKTLLEKGANSNEANIERDVEDAFGDDGTAAYIEHEEIVSYPIHYAVISGNPHSVQYLLDNNANPSVLSRHGKFGPTVSTVYIASQRGFSDILQLLLEHSAIEMINIPYQGETPLMAALRNGHAECASILIDYGADFNKGTNMTPVKMDNFKSFNY